MTFQHSQNSAYQKFGRHRVFGLLVTLAASLTACGGGGGDSSGGSGSGDFSGGGGISNDGSVSGSASSTATALPEMISSQDSSVLRNAVASGLDVTRSLLPTSYFCYAKQTNDYSNPLAVFTISGPNFSLFINGALSSTGQWFPIEENGIRFQSEDFIDFELELTSFGQVLHWESEEFQEGIDSCYQQGGAVEFALQRYILREPDAGDYQCRAFDTGAFVGTLNLQPGGGYSVNGGAGAYTAQNIISAGAESDPSTVEFLNGPFQGSTASYVEIPGSGYQELFFEETTQTSNLAGAASSSSAQMACSRNGAPQVFKSYGFALADEPIPPNVALSGLFAIDTSVRSSLENTNTMLYADFRPNGYVHIGEPFAGGADCSLTNPAGLPYCGTYQYDGNTLIIDAPDEMPVQYTTQSSSGELTLWDEYPVERVTPISRDAVLGDWRYDDTVAGDLSLCLVGFCSGSIFEARITFRSDGTFSSSTEGSGFSSSDFANVSSFSQSQSESFSNGTFTLNGNYLTMNFVNGETSTDLVHFGFDNTILAIGNRGYRRE